MHVEQSGAYGNQTFHRPHRADASIDTRDDVGLMRGGPDERSRQNNVHRWNIDTLTDRYTVPHFMPTRRRRKINYLFSSQTERDDDDRNIKRRDCHIAELDVQLFSEQNDNFSENVKQGIFFTKREE